MEEMDGQDNTRTIADHADNKQDTDRTGQGGTSTGQTHGRSFFFPLFSFALSTFDMLTTGKKRVSFILYCGSEDWHESIVEEWDKEKKGQRSRRKKKESVGRAQLLI